MYCSFSLFSYKKQASYNSTLIECQWLTGLSAGDGLALNWLALARNGCSLQTYVPWSHTQRSLESRCWCLFTVGEQAGSFVRAYTMTATAMKTCTFKKSPNSWSYRLQKTCLWPSRSSFVAIMVLAVIVQPRFAKVWNRNAFQQFSKTLLAQQRVGHPKRIQTCNSCVHKYAKTNQQTPTSNPTN